MNARKLPTVAGTPAGAGAPIAGAWTSTLALALSGVVPAALAAAMVLLAPQRRPEMVDENRPL